MSLNLETPMVRETPPGPETLEQTLSPPAEETTPGMPGPTPRRNPRPRTRPRPGRESLQTAEDEVPPEEVGPSPLDIAEAAGWATPGPENPTSPTPETRNPRSGRPTQPRPRVTDDAVGWPAEDVGPADRLGSTFSALSEAGQAGARRRGPATAANWAEFLTVLLGFLSLIYAWWLLSGLDVAAQPEELALTEEEAEGIATPLSRILARSWVNAAYGKHVLGASDYVVLAIVLAEYGRRTSPYLRQKVSRYVPRRRSAPAPEPARPRREERNGHVDAAAPGSRPPLVVAPVSAT